MSWVNWVEPFTDDFEPVYMRVADKTAIKYMKKIHPELTDDQALREFVVVNWAEVTDDPKYPIV